MNKHILTVQLTFLFINFYFPSQLETGFENVILFSFIIIISTTLADILQTPDGILYYIVVTLVVTIYI